MRRKHYADRMCKGKWAKIACDYEFIPIIKKGL
jgi:hypothetical protein